MPDLKLVTGGKKGRKGTKGTKGRGAGRRDHLAECLFDCLPANSREEIVERMWKLHKLRLTISHIGTLINYVRRNPVRIGYDIPHANRGRLKEGSVGFRFQAALVDHKGRLMYLDTANEAQVIRGLVATVMTIRGLAQNEDTAMQYMAKYLESPSAQRAWRRYCKDLARTAEDAAELLDAIGVVNGN